MAKNEKALQTNILDDLRSFGEYCECFKIMRASDNGEPDIFFTTKLTGGILVETKRLKGSLQKVQGVKVKKLINCGTPTFICNSWEKWVEIKRFLNLTKDNIVQQCSNNIDYDKIKTFIYK